MKQERIVCATWYVHNTHMPTILTEAATILVPINKLPMDVYNHWQRQGIRLVMDGFLTSHGRVVSPFVALQIAIEAGQTDNEEKKVELDVTMIFRKELNL